MMATVWYSGKGKTTETRKWSVVTRGINGGSTGNLKGSETILYHPIMVCHSTECETERTDHKVKYGLSATIMYNVSS